MGFCPEGDSIVNPIVKYILLIGTFLHWICGAGMVAMGAWAFNEKNKYFYQPIEDAYDVIFDLSIILIVTGGIMFIITMCGFVGALRENTILLRIFYFSLAVIFLLEIIGGALVFIFKDKAIETISGVLKDVYISDYQDDENGIMDYFQEQFDCCGIDKYQDYNDNQYFNCTDGNPSALKCAVPYSCCKDPDKLSPGLNNVLCGAETLLQNSTKTDEIWTVGCVSSVIQFLEDNLPVIGGVAIAIAIPQLMGIVLGRMFVGQIEGQWDRYYRKKRTKSSIRRQQRHEHQDQRERQHHREQRHGQKYDRPRY